MARRKPTKICAIVFERSRRRRFRLAPNAGGRRAILSLRALICAAGLGAAPLLAPTCAWATWSIVAVDPQTHEVGVAGASCTANVQNIAGLVPGKGALVAQGQTNRIALDRAIRDLGAGKTSAQVLTAITRPADDPDGLMSGLSYRQYGVAVLGAGTAANFTGKKTFAWAGGVRDVNVTVQGNILRHPAVVTGAMAAFKAPPGVRDPDLAARLLAALEAGARQGGDRRCAPDLAALSAFLVVARPDDPIGKPSLYLVERSNRTYRPGLLRLAWQLWIRPEQSEGRTNPIKALRVGYERRRRGAM